MKATNEVSRPAGSKLEAEKNEPTAVNLEKTHVFLVTYEDDVRRFIESILYLVLLVLISMFLFFG